MAAHRRRKDMLSFRAITLFKVYIYYTKKKELLGKSIFNAPRGASD